MNLWLSLNKALTLYADKLAVIDGTTRLTYAETGKRIAAVAEQLGRLGIRQGDVVAVASPNCHEYLEIYYACGVAGIVLSPLNYRLAGREIATILEDSGSRVLLVHTDFAALVPDVVSGSQCIERVIWFGSGERPKITVPAHEYEDLAKDGELSFFNTIPYMKADDLAHLYYTSGTTGLPKGVMLTQGNVSFNSLAVIADLSIGEADVWLHAAPLFHLADAWATFALTWIGGTHVFIPYFNAIKALEIIEKERVSMTVLVPTMLNAMLNEYGHMDKKPDSSSWRMVITGGSPIAPDMVRRAVHTFGCEYVQLYGMTETSPFLTLSKPTQAQLELSPEDQLTVRAKTGRGYIGAEVRVVREDGTDVDNADVEVGQIVARGPTIFAGYWKQPEATAQTIKNGWIQTGDLATIDKDGYINIVDRAKDMIISGGENIYSTEVEYALCEHVAVLECAVFGIPDTHWGEAVKAVVVLRTEFVIAEPELIAFLRQRLAGYKIPKSIDFLGELPKTGSGKIYKKGLRESYWPDLQKQVN